MAYNFKKIQKKWSDRWDHKQPFKTKPTGTGKKYYVLDMFPYPSGSGLHVGHWRGYVLSDVYARQKALEGYNVLHPMGWDAFGLPAENAAIKEGVHPKESTERNIANFKRQLKDIAAIYDWDKEINTTDPDYYKWTQWIFLQMFKAGLAYETNMPINWCPSCLTGLANEEVTNGTCERCGTPVTQKQIKQWVLKITDYAQKLLDGLEKLDWPEKVKLMQRNWIGRSEGAEINFITNDADGNQLDLKVYTTRPDTIFGATYMVMAPDHPLVEKLIPSDRREPVKIYQEKVSHMSAMDRIADKEKTGVFTGAYAINPANGRKIPIYLSSYVLKDYGTGVIMAVPAHDQRDFEFAKKFELPITQVVESPEAQKDANGNLLEAFEADGTLINSGQFNGLDAKKEGIPAITSFLEEKGIAQRKINYKLRDWIFSRQRYWGEPIPLIHCKECGVVPVPEKDLPVVLPDVKNYRPTGTGQSPLIAISEWVNVPCPQCGKPAKRETNTMPQWAGSCWYFLRYPNPDLKDKPFDEKDMKYWMPVDLYVGGIEHAILHLLYARFYTQVLHDLGYLSFSEPFAHLFNQGMILKHSDKSGHVEKMSKSKGNVVNPDEMVDAYGTDVLRMYILFMGPPELDVEWQDSGLEGIKRFVNRFWVFMTNPDLITQKEDLKVTKRIHRFLKEYQERLAHFKPNTAIASFMELLNDLSGMNAQLSKESIETILVSFSVLAPFMASELLEQLLGKQLESCVWPTYDEALTIQDEVVIAIQINGKLRGDIVIDQSLSKDKIEALAKEHVAHRLEDKTIIKTIYVPGRLINFVVK
jgi:leucyl-tRNA synthetase